MTVLEPRSGVTSRKMPKHCCHLVDSVGGLTDFILVGLKTSKRISLEGVSVMPGQFPSFGPQSLSKTPEGKPLRTESSPSAFAS